VIAFAQNCIEILEDLNVKNYAEFIVQIGIHTGGPMICGVVDGGAGFDVLGGPVKLAGLLQRTAPNNTIQVSEATHAQLSPMASSMGRRIVKVAGKEVATYLIRSAGSSGSSV
jgi:class 3 adenylate cyclase